MVGVFPVPEALYRARNCGLDLVEISPNAEPPVCKIIDYSKYRYEQQKKLNEAKKKRKSMETKEIKVRPTIARGDYEIKLRKATEFIKDGNRVKFSLAFRGREITHNEVGFEIINRFKQDLELIGRPEVEPKLEGKQIFMIIAPKSGDKSEK